MNKSQKISVFMILILTASVSLSVYAFSDPAFNFGLGPPTTGIVICVLVGLAVAGNFYRNYWVSTYQILKKRKVKIELDERDCRILQISEYAGFSFSYVYYVIALMIVWLFKKDEMINSSVLPMIVGFGFYAYEFARSIAVLVQYGRGVEEDS